jgi:hypothetical protein
MHALPGKQAALATENARLDVKRTMWALCLPSAENRAGIRIAQRWQFFDFLGSRGTKSRSVVDIIGISRDHRPAPSVLRRGDLFDIVLIRVNGESGPWPTPADVRRLRAVRRSIVPRRSCWRPGREVPTQHSMC